ncbi:hypothetical protein IC229_21325 [Spirosoma sp. BT702]|uniref:Lipoprotein n=1 Tax=Spirosoma profusum TaxID=2771354 RepID=A0A926XZL8_9BACT|nr:hypothetical protein [Spirosoma profusum]MBD2703201.1 hypothetical protein [Spirosoma profusum]
MFRPILLSVLTAFLLAACSSGKSALKRGDFDLAVKKASQRLNQPRLLSKRGHELAPLVLRDAFKLAYDQHQATIRRFSSANPVNSSQTPTFRWETVYQEYGQLQALTDNARAGNCAACAEWLATYPTSYVEQQREIRQLAAADRYDVAEQAFAYREDDRLAAKDAYLNYRKAIDWVPDFRQARGKAEDALPFAILRVVIEPLSPSHELDRSDSNELQRLISRQIGQQTAPSTFVRFYPPDTRGSEFVPGDGHPIHQAIQMVVSGYTPSLENTSSTCTTVYSNQEYKVGEKKINDSTKVDIKEKVKGTLTTYRREIHASLDMRMRAIDTQTGKVLWEEPIGETRNWATEWQTFSGDDRALNGQSLATANAFPPSRWQLLDSMRDDLASSIASRLRSRYSRE